MKEFFAFIKSKQFFLHFGIATLTVIVTLWILVKSLNSYTQHGESVEVPDFKGKSIKELEAFITGKDLRYQIIDSIYAPKEKPGVVIRQDPETKTRVKRNRTVYLYVTGFQPPQLVMPKLIDRSARQAVLMIESYGLKVGKITEVSGDCNGCVLEQYANGKKIEPGAMVKKGTVISISIGRKERFINSGDSAAVSTDPTNFE